MVISRSHINEQISKGGNKMVDVRKRPGYKKPLKYVKDQKSKSGFDLCKPKKIELFIFINDEFDRACRVIPNRFRQSHGLFSHCLTGVWV